MALPHKVGTGVSGLDEVLEGGLQAGRVYLIEGTPGAGKTTVAMQFLLAGAAQGQSGVYFTLSESREELLATAESHGWSLDGVDIYEVIGDEELDPDQDQSVLHPFDLELGETIRRVIAEVEAKRPVRVVFDSVSEMRLLVQSALRYRRQVLALKRFFTALGCTVLLLDDRLSGRADLQLHSVAHGVIVLEQTPAEYGAERRRVRVMKCRGMTYREGWHDYAIRTGGVIVFPRLVPPKSTADMLDDIVSGGANGLDALLGGGFVRGSAALLMGPSGSGKTSTAVAAALAAVRRGEGVAFFIFDETLASLLTRSAKLGMDLRPHLDKDLTIRQVDPVEVSPGEFTSMVFEAIRDDGVRMVIIDSLNAYMQSVPGERFFLLQMHELLAYLNNMKIVTLMTLGQHGLLGDVRSNVELSYLSDIVVSLRFFEAQGAVRKAVSVIKTRTTAHEPTIRELKLGPDGVRVSEPLRDFRGILSGTPDWTGSATTAISPASVPD